jgi:hypothetical protein
MRTPIKVLTLCAAALAAAAIAGAQDRPEQARLNRKPAGFNCPVCDSPCINKAALQRQVRQRKMQNQNESQVRRDVQPGPPNRQWQGERKNASHRTGQRARQQGIGRFDFDGDGQLSHAEKAARRAYRDALDRQQSVEPNERPAPQPPAE